jgi:hypothetical protein
MLHHDKINYMKNLVCILVLVFFNCSNNTKKTNEIQISDSRETLVFKIKNLEMVLTYNKNDLEKFSLIDLNNNIELSGLPELIKVDGEIPEGTNRIDNNNLDDYRGFECDSSYQFISNDIELSFAVEKFSKKRLDLTIYNSKNKNFPDGDFTLINQKKIN